MSGSAGTAADSATATAAAVRGASLAFNQGRQKTEADAANSRQQHLLPTRQHRLPSVSPSRDGNSADALLAATSAAASRDASSGSAGTRSGAARSGLLRPVSPGRSPGPRQSARDARAGSSQRAVKSSSGSRGRSQSRSRSRGHEAADFGSSPSSGLVAPLGRMRTGGPSPALSPHPRSTSFLAATLAASRTASQTASPGLTPSHTGQQGGGNATNIGGPPPAHLSAALLASAASDERRRAAATATAANLATAALRSTETLARYGITGHLVRASHSTSSLALPAEESDTAANPQTSSLISMFEKEKSGGAGTKETEGKRKATNNDKSPVRPPKPKIFTPPRSMSRAVRSDQSSKPPSAKPATKQSTKPVPTQPSKQAEVTQQQQRSQPEPEPEIQPEPQRSKPIPIPKPKVRPAPRRDKSSSPEKVEKMTSSTTPLRQHRLPLRELNDDDDVMERPPPPKPRLRDASTTSSRTQSREPVGLTRATSFASRGPAPIAPPRRAATTFSGHTASPPTRTATTVDGLASAIMAGSLAAARYPPTLASSPSLPSSRSRTPPPPPASRGSLDVLSSASMSASRSSSPTKRAGMLQTLRRDRALSDDDYDDRDGKSSGNYHYRRSHYHRDGRLRQGRHYYSNATPAALVGGGRHKHKHHEGARRRWRDAITERQRRRYEAVWASNRGRRGMVGGNTEGVGGDGGADDPDDDTVPNVVVRDLWRRSRLPVDELAEVWDLVDKTGTGRLGKTGFVVGLWLIDQRLRGRKIPARVSESVWSSARGMQGMEVLAKQRKR